MYSAQNNFEAKLNALRLLYKRDISGKIQELEQAIQDAHHKPDSRSVGHLRFVSHKLAGSGATFGFPEISAEAKKIERFSASYLEALKENPNKQQVWDDVFDSLHQLKSLAENIQGKKESQKPSDEDIEKLKLSAGKPSAAHFANAPAITANTQATPFSDDAILLRLANEHENEASLLLIEDDHIVSRELSTQLGFLGYRIQSRQALKTLDAQQTPILPDQLSAILIDTGKQEPSSYISYLQALKLDPATSKDLPIIILSTQDNIDARLAALRAGAKAFFTKPVDVGIILDTIRQSRNPTENNMPLRVVIVDDQENMARFYAAILEQRGFDVRIVTDARLALDMMHEFTPDLLLVDMYMPYCSGVELAQIIRQQAAFLSTPIVYLSSETDSDAKLEAMRHGGDDFISKPVNPDYLSTSIRIRALRHQRIRQQIVRDGLTGLFNHTHFKEHIQVELLRAARTQEAISLVMIDIDHFKSVNDQYGHPVGDRVLRLLARFLEQRLRASDICGRFGGEEFGVLLPGSTAQQTWHVMEKLREDFAHIKHNANENIEFHVTFSCGIADNYMSSHAAQLIRFADEALYTAKNSGRNQVVIYAPKGIPAAEARPY